MKKIFGFALLLASIAGNALAGGVPVPEINAPMAIGAMTLLAGGVLVVRSRRK